jgi:hypothetical protein
MVLTGLKGGPKWREDKFDKRLTSELNINLDFGANPTAPCAGRQFANELAGTFGADQVNSHNNSKF